MTSDPATLLQFLVFVAVMTGTPGPNNAMATVSGARVGVIGTLPLILGVSSGVALMFAAVAVGLGELMTRLPAITLVLRVVATAFLLWIAWRILTAGPVTEEGDKRLLGFFGGAAFQWINPKAWAFTGSAATLYLAPGAPPSTIALAALVMALAGLVLVSLWAGFGSLFRERLRSARFARVFNATMAALLLVATVPVLLAD